ncbi:MAG: hypothetical protein J1G06_04415 [Oscillospiraceae bacterium]|nr:hypothetical protein [Oscillospiraceae bacterium]
MIYPEAFMTSIKPNTDDKLTGEKQKSVPNTKSDALDEGTISKDAIQPENR